MQILTQGGGFFAAENGVNSNTNFFMEGRYESTPHHLKVMGL